MVTRRAENVPAWAASAATGGVHAAAVLQHSGARLRRHRLHPGGVPGERRHDVLAVSRSPTSRARHVRYVRFRRRPRAYRLGATSRWPCCRWCQPRPRRHTSELRLGEALHLRLDELDVLDHCRGRHVARVDPRVHPDQGDRAVIDEAAKVRIAPRSCCSRCTTRCSPASSRCRAGTCAACSRSRRTRWPTCSRADHTDSVLDELRQDAEARAGATVPGPGHTCGPASARSNGPRGIRATATAVTLSSAHRSWRRSCGRGRRWRHAGQRFAGPSFKYPVSPSRRRRVRGRR